MKFSTKSRYALRLMVELANRPNDLIPLKDISDKQRISLKYLEQIVAPLSKAGLVESGRGSQGVGVFPPAAGEVEQPLPAVAAPGGEGGRREQRRTQGNRPAAPGAQGAFIGVKGQGGALQHGGAAHQNANV